MSDRSACCRTTAPQSLSAHSKSTQTNKKKQKRSMLIPKPCGVKTAHTDESSLAHRNQYNLHSDIQLEWSRANLHSASPCSFPSGSPTATSALELFKGCFQALSVLSATLCLQLSLSFPSSLPHLGHFCSRSSFRYLTLPVWQLRRLSLRPLYTDS